MNSPLGGVLKNRQCPKEALADRKKHAATLPRLSADRNLVLEVEKIANGTFSPLEGFMGSEDTQSVLDTMHMKNGLPWTVPIILHAKRSEAEGLRPGSRAAIINTIENVVCATIEVDEVFSYDKERFARSVFGTIDAKHPGVGLLQGWGEMAVAGRIELLEKSKSLIPGGFDLSPAEVRAEVERRGWKRMVGFQTRNIGHRAHEYLQKVALEHADGILIHPLIGWKKAGDMQPDVILEGYQILIDKYFVKERVMLAALTTAMRYAGPKEAVFHSIIRKNFGCTDFIVGRDHAGVGGYYDKYAAHRIFSEFGDELGIRIMKLHGPCWCNRCDSIVTEHTCPHESDWVQISGTDVRAMLSRGERPPLSFMRPEIGDFLVQRASEGRVFV